MFWGSQAPVWTVGGEEGLCPGRLPHPRWLKPVMASWDSEPTVLPLERDREEGLLELDWADPDQSWGGGYR